MHISLGTKERKREKGRQTRIYRVRKRGSKGEGGREKHLLCQVTIQGRQAHFFFFDKHIYQERGLAHRFTLCPKNDLYFECYGSGLVSKSCPTLATPWTEKPDRLQFMGFSRQEYWSELPFPSPGDLPNPGIEPRFPAF